MGAQASTTAQGQRMQQLVEHHPELLEEGKTVADVLFYIGMLKANTTNSEEVLAQQCDEFEARLEANQAGKARVSVRCLTPGDTENKGGKLSNTSIALNVDDTTTVRELKQMIEAANGVPVDQQWLVVEGMQQREAMVDSQPLKTYECVLKKSWPWATQKGLVMATDPVWQDHSAGLLGRLADPSDLAASLMEMYGDHDDPRKAEKRCADRARPLIANAGTDINALRWVPFAIVTHVIVNTLLPM